MAREPVDVAGLVGPGRAPAERRHTDDASDVVPGERLGGGPREAHEGGFDRASPRVRRREPEDGLGASECLVDDSGIAV